MFTGRMLLLPPNQQRQSTEGNVLRAVTNKPVHYAVLIAQWIVHVVVIIAVNLLSQH